MESTLLALSLLLFPLAARARIIPSIDAGAFPQ
jgi:hypothetical protein